MADIRRSTATMTVSRRTSRHRPENDVNEFLLRNGMPRSSIRHCMEYARTRLPRSVIIEPIQSQGYCSVTLLAATEPVASIIQFRPEAHRMDVAMADDIRAIFGPVAPITRSIGYLFVPGLTPTEKKREELRGAGRHYQGRLRDHIFHRHHHDHDGSDSVSSSSSSTSSSEDEDEHLRSHRQHTYWLKEEKQRHRQDPNNQVILHVYSMSFLPGTPLTTHRISRLPPNVAGAHRAALIRSLAQHYAIAWHNGRYPDAPRRPQTTVASSLRGRLEAMACSLPSRFRTSAAQVLARLTQIESLPWVMTHGDLVPVNILVDPRRGEISGLIDWAEAEYLPFGTGLYGLEEVLSHAASLPEEEPHGRKRWAYYSDVTLLRELFWSELFGMVPELREGGVMDTVRLAGQMGVLLWCGIAFDDGRLDRVVQEGRDSVEIAKLDLFLLSPDGCKDNSPMRVEEEARLSRLKHTNTFMFAKSDDEENVQELRDENPIRYRL